MVAESRRPISSRCGRAAQDPARAAVPLMWEATSTDIRWGPSLTTAIVTHLVTRFCCTLGAALTISLGMSAIGELEQCFP